MGRRLPAVLLVVAVALAVTGASVAVIRLKSEPRRAVVEALARRPQDLADSARYLVRYTVENPGISSEFATYEGTADFVRQRFLARGGDIHEAGSVDEAEYFVFAQWQYFRSEDDPRWRRGFPPAPKCRRADAGADDCGSASPPSGGSRLCGQPRGSSSDSRRPGFRCRLHGTGGAARDDDVALPGDTRRRASGASAGTARLEMMRPLAELRNVDDPAWPTLRHAIERAGGRSSGDRPLRCIPSTRLPTPRRW